MRADALIWLDEGEPVDEIAQRLGISRQSVYNCAVRVQQRDDSELHSRLADAPRSGRPCTAKGVMDSLVQEVIDTDPRQLGYRSTVWTVFFFQAEDGIRDYKVSGVHTCALPISRNAQDLHAHVARDDGFGHRGHADRVGTDRSQISDLRGRFVTGTQQSHIDAVREAQPDRPSEIGRASCRERV